MFHNPKKTIFSAFFAENTIILNKIVTKNAYGQIIFRCQKS